MQLPELCSAIALIILIAEVKALGWAVRLDGSGDDRAQGLSTDLQGNVYVAGFFTSTPMVIFDSVGNNAASLTSGGGFGAYVAKFAANGSYLWAARLDDTVDDFAHVLSTD